MKYWEDDGIHIYIDSINIESMKGSATFSIGKTTLKEFYSLTKENEIGEISGNNNEVYINPVDSPIYDLDRFDAILDAEE